MSARQKKKAEEDWRCQEGWGGVAVLNTEVRKPPPPSDTGVD